MPRPKLPKTEKLVQQHCRILPASRAKLRQQARLAKSKPGSLARKLLERGIAGLK